MSTTAATATVEVPCDPDTAFEIFTRDIGAWWKRGTHCWNDADKALQLRFEPSGSGTLVTVEHVGWDRVPSADRGQIEGYGEGWAELLGMYAQSAEGR
jgi:uncharacterized protein YndB with AHSA1/START domain